ncbi:hypothetical protein [Fibrella aquatilis]|uniref:Uncharacterized protein n=1 Tax=Fibrella aquatilis TaxID=2817059 RepID=A0A939G5Y5_9BACT|nr:hypothetical protein [Fibrella aquatilis]MBO0932749.1 hypothetical protein [Fibrella aquatilis]
MIRPLLTLALLSAGYLAQAQSAKTAAAKPATAAASAAAPASTAPAEDKEKKAEFVDRLFSEQSYLNAQIVDKCFTFKFSPTCWTKFTDPNIDTNEGGFPSMRYWVRYAVEYAKREKIGDLMTLAVDDKQVEKENRPMIDEMIKTLRSKFSLTVEAPVACTGKAYEMMMRYPYEVMQRIGQATPEWSPKSGEAHFTVSISSTAKDMAVKISPDGKQFMVSGPAYVEAYSTADKIYNGMERANKNR